jgi:hypothetical protein
MIYIIWSGKNYTEGSPGNEYYTEKQEAIETLHILGYRYRKKDDLYLTATGWAKIWEISLAEKGV